MTVHEFISCNGRPGGRAHIEIHPGGARHEAPDGSFVDVIHSDDDGNNEERVTTRVSASVVQAMVDAAKAAR